MNKNNKQKPPNTLLSSQTTYLTKQPEKSGIKKTSTPKREKEVNKNNKQKPPNTLLSSQTTHPPDRARRPRRKAAISRAGR
ncbi:hypothetical protein H7J82_26170 [Mycolicibacterium poriferae]|uniref:hypothetical protein n=1 Tax=Mycolicibacterium poriferae TaxID=39694 RepID=UPI0021F2716C|nr:hypothetical protein [Mycolicibacterium poriferae]MCV7266491.1 hypothetical protein [Mycolicibacterium poriferae]